MNLAVRLQEVQEQVINSCKKAGRNPDEVALIAVSKTHPYELISEAMRLGQLRFGESYIQEALPKIERFEEDRASEPAREEPVEWHFIGHLQTRKAREAAGRFALIHSVDSVRLAQALHKRMEQIAENCSLDSAPEPASVRQPILIQVNIGREEQKSGVLEEHLPALLEQALELPRLHLRGLMCIPPFDGPPEDARRYFSALRELRDGMELRFGKGILPELSMGMSQDFELAIAEGATLVRVGTSIFGRRNYAQQ
ncbi:MAG: YggS family pyridoxal phosphate-dependent enzyme [Desulfovibrionaceae bacterium]|nr:YggS family pyridoxal phosphate-dependent enzyme [Desulfovibrionaceae bacterium]